MKTILIVDDDPTIVTSLHYLLEQADYNVLVARDGREALDVLQRELPDLILLDVMMPRMSGYEVCQHVRESAAWRHIRIVMLTARGGAIAARKGLALGADGYITKPFSNRELLDGIGELLVEEVSLKSGTGR
jgi:DNA-binding response OmpR family regulator